jgi:hypothetical protein
MQRRIPLIKNIDKNSFPSKLHRKFVDEHIIQHNTSNIPKLLDATLIKLTPFKCTQMFKSHGIHQW